VFWSDCCMDPTAVGSMQQSDQNTASLGIMIFAVLELRQSAHWHNIALVTAIYHGHTDTSRCLVHAVWRLSCDITKVNVLMRASETVFKFNCIMLVETTHLTKLEYYISLVHVWQPRMAPVLQTWCVISCR